MGRGRGKMGYYVGKRCLLTEIWGFSTLKMKAVRSPETLVCNHHTTRHKNPENHEFNKKAGDLHSSLALLGLESKGVMPG